MINQSTSCRKQPKKYITFYTFYLNSALANSPNSSNSWSEKSWEGICCPDHPFSSSVIHKTNSYLLELKLPTLSSHNHWDNSYGWVSVAAHSHGPGTCRAPLSCQGHPASSAHRRQPPRSATWGDNKIAAIYTTTLLWSTWSCFIPMNVLTWSLCLRRSFLEGQTESIRVVQCPRIVFPLHHLSHLIQGLQEMCRSIVSILLGYFPSTK